MSDFLEAMPGLITGKTELDAFFVTYKEIAGYEDRDSVDTGKPGLRIFIDQGGHRYNYMEEIGLIIIALSSGKVSAEVEAIDSTLQRARNVFNNMKSQNDSRLADLGNRNLFVVVYAGIAVFNESLDYACKLKKNLPQAVVIVLTCDCDISNKERVMDKFLTAGKIDHAVYSGECGGRRPMGDILRMLIALWPQAK